MSHELREPLAAIRGSATTLLEEAAQLDPAETREFHRIIVKAGQAHARLIGDGHCGFALAPYRPRGKLTAMFDTLVFVQQLAGGGNPRRWGSVCTLSSITKRKQRGRPQTHSAQTGPGTVPLVSQETRDGHP